MPAGGSPPPSGKKRYRVIVPASIVGTLAALLAVAFAVWHTMRQKTMRCKALARPILLILKALGYKACDLHVPSDLALNSVLQAAQT